MQWAMEVLPTDYRTFMVCSSPFNLLFSSDSKQGQPHSHAATSISLFQQVVGAALFASEFQGAASSR